jgi:hypothetical protein
VEDLFYGNLGASLSGAGDVLNALVNDGANCLKKLKTRIGEVLADGRRYTKTFLYSV